MEKILYIITKSNWGGAQRYVYDLATNISKERFDIVVAFGGNGELKKRLEKRRVRTITIRDLERDIFIWKDLISFIDILRLLRQEKPRIVHLNSSKAGALGVAACRIYNCLNTYRFSRNIKIIFTVHGWAFTEDRPFFSRVIVKFIQWLTVLLSHRTIAVSENTKREASGFPYVHDKIHIIHNGIGVCEFHHKDDAREELASKSARVPKHFIWIGVIAELHKNKGIQYAIEAVDHLRDTACALFIVGEGEERKSLESLIHKKGFEKKIFLLGYVENMHVLLKAFDIFLLTSEKEGLPYALLEAGSAGIPIIASNIGGIPNFIRNKENGILVQPRNIEEIATALKTLVENADKRKTYGTRIERSTRSNFSLQKMLTETLEMYSSLLKM